jgi:hypothetical protein
MREIETSWGYSTRRMAENIPDCSSYNYEINNGGFQGNFYGNYTDFIIDCG